MTVTELFKALEGALTVPELARVSNKHESTIRREIRRQRLRALRVGPRGTLVTPDAVREWLQMDAADAEQP
jgi:excisionase family DNA binding protein